MELDKPLARWKEDQIRQQDQALALRQRRPNTSQPTPQSPTAPADGRSMSSPPPQKNKKIKIRCNAKWLD
jgi:hypothetical protein